MDQKTLLHFKFQLSVLKNLQHNNVKTFVNTAGLVGCAYKGWGTQYMADLALLIISAWILPSEDKVVSFSTTIAKNTAHLDTVPLSPSVSIDNHLFIVKVSPSVFQ